jgi:two-component system cell cycle sensor histidine kinase/response regulator CckA
MPEQTDRSQVVILVVDGEVVARNSAAGRLNRDGYTVLAAAHGLEALEVLRTYEGRIDLLIADMEIPKIDALQLCAEAVGERPSIRTCTMSFDASDRERAAGCNVAYVPKPLDPDLLRREFEDLLR